MAIIKAVSSKAPIKTAINYVTKEEKTEQKLQSGIGCEPESAYDEMQATKEAWGKTGGRQYKHYVQSFAPGETTPEQAHAIGKELAENNEAWKGFEVLVSTHKDREHIHNHFIINSVSYEDGHKIQDGPKDLNNLKAQSNELCQREGLSVMDLPEKKQKNTRENKDIFHRTREAEEIISYNKDTYKILKEADQGKTQSYVQDIAAAIIEEKQTAQSREEFIENMTARGYGVDWSDSRKNITFTDKEREANGEKKCKVRNSTLDKYYNIDFSKEALENEFNENRTRAERAEDGKSEPEGRERAAEQRDLIQNPGELSASERIVRIEAKLEEIREDRERASESESKSNGSGSDGIGKSPDGEQGSEKSANGKGSRMDAEIERTEAEFNDRANETRNRTSGASGAINGSVRAIDRAYSSLDQTIRDSGEQHGDEVDHEFNRQQQQFVGMLEDVTRLAERFEKIRGQQQRLGGKQQEIGNGITGAKTDQREIESKQQHLGRKFGDFADRLRELRERIEENLQRVFRRGR